MRAYETAERMQTGMVILVIAAAVYIMCIEPIVLYVVMATLGGFVAAYLLGWGYLEIRAYVARRAARTPDTGDGHE